jgi:hypothetical protein
MARQLSKALDRQVVGVDVRDLVSDRHPKLTVGGREDFDYTAAGHVT